MPGYARQHYLDVVEGYFAAITRDQGLPPVLEYFTPGAEVIIFHGDNPTQHFHHHPAEGQRSFGEFWGHLWDNYTARFDDMTMVIDAEADTGAAFFSPHLDPKPGSAYGETGALTLNNSNFFWFKDGKIDRMVIYYANPTLGAKLDLAGIPPHSPARSARHAPARRQARPYMRVARAPLPGVGACHHSHPDGQS